MNNNDVDNNDVDNNDVDNNDVDNNDVEITPHVEYMYALIAEKDQIFPGACGDTYETLQQARRYYDDAVKELPEPLNTLPVVIIEATTTFKVISDDDL